ncbi:hypothetical protein BH11MYX1_BH11MYX1_49460 [soil metagenome]
MGAPAWATFHTLDLGSFAGWNTGYAEREWILELVSDPAMRWLRRVGPMRAEGVIALIDHGTPLPWTDLEIEKSREVVEHVIIEALAEVRSSFPSLRRLAIDLPKRRLPASLRDLGS